MFCALLLLLLLPFSSTGMGGAIWRVEEHLRVGRNPVVHSRPSQDPQIARLRSGNHAQPAQPRSTVRAVRPRPGACMNIAVGSLSTSGLLGPQLFLESPAFHPLKYKSRVRTFSWLSCLPWLVYFLIHALFDCMTTRVGCLGPRVIFQVK